MFNYQNYQFQQSHQYLQQSFIPTLSQYYTGYYYNAIEVPLTNQNLYMQQAMQLIPHNYHPTPYIPTTQINYPEVNFGPDPILEQSNPLDYSGQYLSNFQQKMPLAEIYTQPNLDNTPDSISRQYNTYQYMPNLNLDMRYKPSVSSGYRKTKIINFKATKKRLGLVSKRFSEAQVGVLESEYSKLFCERIFDPQKIKYIAKVTSLKEAQVRKWMHNKRQRSARRKGSKNQRKTR